MEKRRDKKIILAWVAVILLILLALGLRLNFVIKHRQVPVVWDAAGYNIQAKEFLAAFRAWPDRSLFLRHFTRAYEMALPKCELYPLFLSGVYALGQADFQTARLAQAILGALTCFLLFLICRRLFNLAVALFALLIAALYIPFILSEGRLLTETLAIFVLVLTNFLLVLSMEKGKWFWIFLAGISTALLVVSRTFFQYIFIFYWPALIIGMRIKRIRWSLPRSLFFLIGLALIIVPRLFWTPRVDKLKRPLISGSWRNGLAIYCGIYPPNQGLQSNANPGGEILNEIVRERGHRSPDDDDFFRAYLRIMLTEPAEAIPVLLAKGWLFWKRAYNDFLQSYILSPEGINIFNRVLLLLGLLGIPLLFGLGPRSWFWLISIIYTWAVCFLSDAESRYTLPAMPFMIGTAAWFVDRFIRGLVLLKRQGRGVLLCFYLSLFLGGGCLILSRIFRCGLLLSLIPDLGFIAAFRIRVLLICLAVVALVPLLFTVYRSLISGWRRLAAAIFPPFLILMIFFSALKVHPTWNQWRCRLADEVRKITQVIKLPPDIENYRSAELKIDMVSCPRPQYDLLVKVDGELVRRFGRGLTADDWIPPDKKRAFPIYLRQQRRKLIEVKQWFGVPIDIRKLRGKEVIEVELEFIPIASAPDSYLDLYGDYPVNDDPRVFEGPTFSTSSADLSLYKYLYEDDWRLWQRTRLEAFPIKSASSGQTQGDDDLCPEEGIQSGRYRIFLELSRLPPRSSGFPVAVQREEYLTKKTVPAHYFGLMLWEVNPWKRESGRILLEAAHVDAGEKGGFKMVAYADSDGDGRPDTLLDDSSYLTADKAGEWSSWEFTTGEKRLFVGIAWPEEPGRKVYYERALWPRDVFPEVMYYTTGPNAATAYPVLTNLRITFLKEKGDKMAEGVQAADAEE